MPGSRDVMTMLEGVTAGPAERPFGVLPVLAPLAPLLPDMGLAKGSVLAVDRAGALCAALMAGPSQAGQWCGVAGIPELGIAAAGVGIEPSRMMLIPRPGPKWAEVAAVMLDACAVVLLRPPGTVPAVLRRPLDLRCCQSAEL